MRQLLPLNLDSVDPLTVYGDLPQAGSRPAVRLNMVASVDGRTSVRGSSGALGGQGDHRVFLVLRALADVILVAAGTVRSENYGPARLPSTAQDARRRRGQTPEPAIAVVSRSCQLDWQSRFFTDATSRPLVITAAKAPSASLEVAAGVADVVVAGSTTVELPRALDALAQRGARSVLAEGGPTLNGYLAGAGLLDELCLTLSPHLVGSDVATILGPATLRAPEELCLRSVCEEDNFLFLRFRTRRAIGHSGAVA
jgi:riboflavin biosynthesis pyrimidine reductase